MDRTLPWRRNSLLAELSGLATGSRFTPYCYATGDAACRRRGISTSKGDIAILFERDTQITKALDTIRRLRDGAPERMLIASVPRFAALQAAAAAGRREKPCTQVVPSLPACASESPNYCSTRLALPIPTASAAAPAKTGRRPTAHRRCSRPARAGSRTRKTLTRNPPNPSGLFGHASLSRARV